MRRWLAGLAVALLAGLALTLWVSGALAHTSGCHTQHTCPSDHATYVWTDSSRRDWLCVRPGASEYDSSFSTTIVYQGLTYHCKAAGSTSAPPSSRPCTKPAGVQNITFSATKYPDIRRHLLRALRKGWPRILVLNRKGAEARRERLLASYPTKRGFDRDEYPPAIGRGIGPGLTRGANPTGWMADVEYVPSAENRSHGSVMGIKLRRFCDGTRFRYVFY